MTFEVQWMEWASFEGPPEQHEQRANEIAETFTARQVAALAVAARGKSSSQRRLTAGGMSPVYVPEFATLVEYFTYAFASAAGLAVFLRNVVGTLKDLKDLQKRFTITVRLGQRELELENGDDLEKVIADLSKQIKADEDRKA
jgi:hypothetical protein